MSNEDDELTLARRRREEAARPVSLPAGWQPDPSPAAPEDPETRLSVALRVSAARLARMAELEQQVADAVAENERIRAVAVEALNAWEELGAHVSEDFQDIARCRAVLGVS
jgi:hypothetical protein